GTAAGPPPDALPDRSRVPGAAASPRRDGAEPGHRGGDPPEPPAAGGASMLDGLSGADSPSTVGGLSGSDGRSGPGGLSVPDDVFAPDGVFAPGGAAGLGGASGLGASAPGSAAGPGGLPGGVAPEADPEAVARAVAGTLLDVARRSGGALLCLDDVHRMDEATRAVLRALPGMLSTAPLLVVLALD